MKKNSFFSFSKNFKNHSSYFDNTLCKFEEHEWKW